MDITTILIEVGKHAFVVAVFAGCLVYIVKLLAKNQQNSFDAIAIKQTNFELSVAEKFDKVEARFGDIDDKFRSVDGHIEGVRTGVGRLADNVNSSMASLSNEIRDANNNVKLIAIKLGANPLDYIKENR